MPYSREHFTVLQARLNTPEDDSARRSEPQLNERLLCYLRGVIELEGPMTPKEVARLLGFASPEKYGARKAQEYLEAL